MHSTYVRTCYISLWTALRPRWLSSSGGEHQRAPARLQHPPRDRWSSPSTWSLSAEGTASNDHITVIALSREDTETYRQTSVLGRVWWIVSDKQMIFWQLSCDFYRPSREDVRFCVYRWDSQDWYLLAVQNYCEPLALADAECSGCLWVTWLDLLLSEGCPTLGRRATSTLCCSVSFTCSPSAPSCCSRRICGVTSQRPCCSGRNNSPSLSSSVCLSAHIHTHTYTHDSQAHNNTHALSFTYTHSSSLCEIDTNKRMENKTLMKGFLISPLSFTYLPLKIHLSRSSFLSSPFSIPRFPSPLPSVS